MDSKSGFVVGKSFPVLKLKMNKNNRGKVTHVPLFPASVDAHHIENSLNVSETEAVRCGTLKQFLNPFSLDAQLQEE